MAVWRDVFFSKPQVQHTFVLWAIKELESDESPGSEVIFEGLSIPLRVITEHGIDFRRSVNRGAKRDQEQRNFDFILIYDSYQSVFLIDPLKVKRWKNEQKGVPRMEKDEYPDVLHNSGTGRSTSKKGRALIPRSGEDRVFTPSALAESIVSHFPIQGKILEPCRGSGAFTNALYYQLNLESDWCEISEGRDFFDYDKKVDWIVTNPPWSLFAEFLGKSLEVADEIVFLVTVNHFTTKKRMRMIREAGFAFREILLVDTPKSFPQSGFQVAAVWISKGWEGDCRFSRLYDGVTLTEQ